jgi:signal transduction histidine kinase
MNRTQNTIRKILQGARWRTRTPLPVFPWSRNRLRDFARARFGTFSVVLMFFCILLGGCRQRDAVTTDNHPVIEFTHVPTTGAGDPKNVNAIRGRVIGAKPGQRIVLYTRDETTWWVQPQVDHPFTDIQENSTWANSTHPGNLYAALLVGPDFQPPATAEVLPTQGVLSTSITQGALPFWRKWWFLPVYLAGGLLLAFGFYRLRLLQLTKTMNLRFEERLAERMRVAQELHDTLLQGMISASMQLDVAVDHVPADSPAQPALRHILKIMGQVIEEGRNTLRGLRSSTESARDVELAFLRIPADLGVNQNVSYRVVVEGTPQPLHAVIHDEIYSIGREAVVNAYRHSGGSHIEVGLEYAATRMRVLVRDNGRGINPEVLRWGRDGHWGLLGMRERAERIGAKFKVMSGASAGTEIELSVPGHIAFQNPRSNGRSSWLSKLRPRTTREETLKVESEMQK